MALAVSEGWMDSHEAVWDDGCIIAAVPADPRRKALRGWDPVSALASALRGRTCPKLLRKKTGKEQKRLNLEERLVYPSGKISSWGRISPRGDVILLDDVVTTGATLSECANILKTAGAGAVRCLTLVREL
jgi:competence protein ComFC